jgi:hypothetical protein
MIKTYVTHPDNLKYVTKIIREQEKNEIIRDSNFIHFINPFSSKIITNEYMEKEKWTGRWEVLQNKFMTYWDGKGEPPSWCVYFRFVIKEMTPLFYETKESRVRVWNPLERNGKF